jgi:hypothetical protein
MNVHRQLIYDVSQAYDRLVNAAGQEEAAGIRHRPPCPRINQREQLLSDVRVSGNGG